MDCILGGLSVAKLKNIVSPRADSPSLGTSLGSFVIELQHDNHSNLIWMYVGRGLYNNYLDPVPNLHSPNRIVVILGGFIL